MTEAVLVGKVRHLGLEGIRTFLTLRTKKRVGRVRLG